ncbi:MAG TPA: hypothetical protein VF006_17530 [Longimicrobium sp.]
MRGQVERVADGDLHDRADLPERVRAEAPRGVRREQRLHVRGRARKSRQVEDTLLEERRGDRLVRLRFGDRTGSDEVIEELRPA